MGKILNVNFKKKELEYTWDDETEFKKKVTAQLDKDFKAILDKIVFLTDNDVTYQRYVAHMLGLIMCNLRGRLKKPR